MGVAAPGAAEMAGVDIEGKKRGKPAPLNFAKKLMMTSLNVKMA